MIMTVGMNPLEAAHTTRVDINGFTGQTIRGKQATQLGVKVFDFDLPSQPEAGALSCIAQVRGCGPAPALHPL